MIPIQRPPDAGWRRLTEIPKFNAVATTQRTTNVGRVADRVAIYADITAITKQHTSTDIISDLKRAKIPHAVTREIFDVRLVGRLALAAKLHQRARRCFLRDGRCRRRGGKAAATA